MGVDVAHLVQVALRDASDEVAEDRLHSPESGHVLPNAVVHLDRKRVGLRLRERDRQVAEVLDELACYREECSLVKKKKKTVLSSLDVSFGFRDGFENLRTSGALDGDKPGLDVDLDYSAELASFLMLPKTFKACRRRPRQSFTSPSSAGADHGK